jgi:hypothetical protein
MSLGGEEQRVGRREKRTGKVEQGTAEAEPRGGAHALQGEGGGVSAGEDAGTASTHQLIIDRFDGELAVVEVDGTRFIELPRWLLPAEAREDDLLTLTTRTTPDGAITHEIRVDAAATAQARAEAQALVDRLRRKDPGGDLIL